MKRVILILAALAPSACIPSFESVECYSDFDCPGDLICGADNACAIVRPDAGPPDAGFPDAGPIDAGFRDASPIDAGFPDASPGDAGFPDASPVDAGAPDAGSPDAGFDLRLEPPALDFGVERIGCPRPALQATLHNAGSTSVEISSIGRSQGTSGEYAVTARAAPFTLAPGAQETIAVDYVPNDVGVDTGALEVTWGDPARLLSSGLRAEGVLSGLRTDRMTQGAGPLDVLFVIDDSMGMAPFQQQLASDLTFLMLTLAFEGWDWQIGVTTTDISATGPAGALVGTPAIVTAQTANAEQVLAARVQQGVGGSSTEAGMEAARLALSPPLTGGANAGFLRPNAALLIYFLSNEDDQSSMSVATYASFLNGLKSDADTVAAHVIVSNLSSCFAGGSTATYAGRYLGLAPLTGGSIEHICDASYQSLMSLMPPVPRNRRFTLSAAADPATIEVRADGQPVPSTEWTYEAATREVVFAPGAAPELGVEIQVDYSIVCS